LLKILHITNNDYDGAGKAAVRLNNSLNNLNINSQLLVLYKKTNDKNIITIQSGKTFKSLFKKILTNFFFVNLNEYNELLKLFLFRAKE
jgi:predicted transcriptional regulator